MAVLRNIKTIVWNAAHGDASATGYSSTEPDIYSVLCSVIFCYVATLCHALCPLAATFYVMWLKNFYKPGITYGKSIAVMWYYLKLTCCPSSCRSISRNLYMICSTTTHRDMSDNQCTQLVLHSKLSFYLISLCPMAW